MQHTKCGLAGASDAELRARTGADLDFLPIADHEASLRADIERLSSTPYLSALRTIGGFVYDVDSGRVEDMVRWERPG
jgi:carbonic anhydrase